jgi:DNA-binding beta-propeller fold protein YncE
MRLRPRPLDPSAVTAVGTGGLVAALREGTGLVLLALLCLQTTSWLMPSQARAEACPGAAACPYGGVQLIGHRAERVLRFPEAVAIGPQGDIYVADQLTYAVQKFSPEGALEGQWGSYGGGRGQFGPIGGLAVDAAGYVYVVDSSHDRVEKFDANGGFLLSWGRHGSEPGQFSFGSSQDPTKPPGGGIAVTGGYVFVADSGNNRIQRFTLQGREPMPWGAKGSAPGQFRYPRGLAANEHEVIVADDDNHRIEQFDLEGAFQAETGTQGKGPGQFGFPYGVALDGAGNVYVADDLNHRVVKLTPQLAFVGAWGGFGGKPGQLAFPRALASDAAGRTYVADTANDRVQVFDPQGNYLRTIGASARGPAELTGPLGVAVDPTGRLLVSDTVDDRIELFAPGTNAYAGQWSEAGGASTAFYRPTGIGVDPRGAVYVVDRGYGRLLKLWGDGTWLAEVGGPAARGGVQLNGNGAAAVWPAAQQTYVADSGHNRILAFGPEGLLHAAWGAGGGNGAAGSGPGAFNHPQALAVDGAGTVYVADTGNDRVVRLSPTGAVTGAWGRTGSANGSFRSPSGIALDAAGEVYVTDTNNNRVQVFDANGRWLRAWGNRGTAGGQFSQPTALAVGCDGDVYVADTNNNRVQHFQLLDRHGTGCLPAGSWPPPLDVAPVVNVRLLRARGVLARRALSMSVSCKRGCKVLATASLAPADRDRRAVRLVSVARALPAARNGHVRLRVGPAGLRRLRSALGHRRALRARVTVVAVGPTGRRATVRRSYLVTR